MENILPYSHTLMTDQGWAQGPEELPHTLNMQTCEKSEKEEG